MESIQRILFIAPKVHIYAVPPLSSNSGYKAGDWKVDHEKSRIFTARIRIVETATEDADGKEEKVCTDVRLEDPKTGDLFANCPYEVCSFISRMPVSRLDWANYLRITPQGAHCVEQVIDSSRFFALRVIDGPRKAMLGIGFEERSEAFDFGVSLQEVRRHNDSISANEKAKKAGALSGLSNVEAKDYSLKEGETINITIGVRLPFHPPFLLSFLLTN